MYLTFLARVCQKWTDILSISELVKESITDNKNFIELASSIQPLIIPQISVSKYYFVYFQ